MTAVTVEKLTKTFQVPEKDPGLRGALASLVRRRFRTVRAVEEISFQVQPGEVVGFIGANGAGKTTTLKMLSGLLHPSSGTARVLGSAPWDRDTAFLKQISLVMGNRSQLWWELPAQETLALNQKIYGVPDREFRRTLEELTELLDLRDCLNVPVKKLSLGQRMKAELCASLLHLPKLLLLDEPTLGLDVVMQKRIRGFIRDYNQKHGATVLLTSHNMDDVVEVCPRLLIIDRGKLLYDGSLEAVIRRYATHKVIRVDFGQPVQRRDLEELGSLRPNGLEPPHPTLPATGVGSVVRAVLEVTRREVSKKASQLLSRFPVVDLTIEETPMEEIVRQIFGERS